MNVQKHYLGDGVYLSHLGDGVIELTTENGIETTNRIVLEPEVLEALLLHVEAERQRRAAR